MRGGIIELEHLVVPTVTFLGDGSLIIHGTPPAGTRVTSASCEERGDTPPLPGKGSEERGDTPPLPDKSGYERGDTPPPVRPRAA